MTSMITMMKNMMTTSIMMIMIISILLVSVASINLTEGLIITTQSTQMPITITVHIAPVYLFM